MNRIEQTGMLLVVLACIVAVCNRYFMPMVLPVVIIVLFVGLSNNMTHATVVSARKAAQSAKAAGPKKPPPLAQTKNPRHKPPPGAAPPAEDEEPAAPPPPPESSEGAEEEKAPPPRPSLATTDAFQYTPQGMQAKLDERQFRRIDSMQPREARIRMLNALYQEMLDTSVKGDPAMRRKDDTSDGCAPLRGRTKPFIM